MRPVSVSLTTPPESSIPDTTKRIMLVSGGRAAARGAYLSWRQPTRLPAHRQIFAAQPQLATLAASLPGKSQVMQLHPEAAERVADYLGISPQSVVVRKIVRVHAGDELVEVPSLPGNG